MRISSKSKIAFNVLLDIAAHTAHGHAISMPLISKRQGLSLSYLEIIFATLKAAGMIQSHRGPGGGYSLAANPANITLKDLVSLIEGDQAPHTDLGADLWSDLQGFMLEQMSHITLQKVLQESVIQIEASTKGLPAVRPKSNLQQKNRSTLKLAKPAPKKVRPNLGPNSIFALGKYLQLKKN
jgi:Rrf2 family iron-sulfur cluster assembly transcriptional regulator